MSSATATKPNNHQVRRIVSIQADANGVLPDRVELIKAGNWPEMSNKGAFWITPGDLAEYKANFDQKIGTPGNSGQLAIDFKHEDHDIAGCWIHAMEVSGDTLWGTNLEYTTTGAALIKGGEFKFLSPSFYPRCLGEWEDPEDWSIRATNVIVGAAFTNIPFMKGLQPVKASQGSQGGNDENILFIDADAKGASMRTLDEARILAAADLTDEDKTLLEQNKAKLSADERKKFGIAEETTVINADEGVKITADQKQILADIQSGKKVLVEAAVHQKLEESVNTLNTRLEATEKQLGDSKTKEIQAAVEAHALAGRIKADQVPKWVARVQADATILDDLAAMDVNPILASEQGKDKGGENNVNADEDLDAKIRKVMADDKISYAAAVGRVAASNPDAVNNREAQLKADAGKN